MIENMDVYSKSTDRAWSPFSWEKEDATYFFKNYDPLKIREVCAYLQAMPPLVSVSAIDTLYACLKRCAEKRSFILHTGECAELFTDSCKEIVHKKIALSYSLKSLLQEKIEKEVVSIDRIAGQYAKPRSNRLEVQNGVSLFSYFGDIFNSIGFTLANRLPRPERLLDAYLAAWETIKNAKEFIQAAGMDPYFISHEALNLFYEGALTREVEGRYFDLSTHLPWIGMRTALTSPAHLHYAAGIMNPIGIKIGETMTPEKLLEILYTVNPKNVANRVLLITRLGAAKVKRSLVPLIESVVKRDLPVLWMCDPMHGNTETLQGKFKVRRVENILKELEDTIAVHKRYNTEMCGIHLEVSREDVTECIDDEITEARVETHYKAIVDPRLNPKQAHSVVEFVGERIG